MYTVVDKNVAYFTVNLTNLDKFLLFFYNFNQE